MSLRFRAVLNLALLAIAGMATSAVPAFGLTRGSMPCKFANRAVGGLEYQFHSNPDCVTTHGELTGVQKERAMRMRRKRLIANLAVVLTATLTATTANTAAATPLISVDLQSSYGTEGAPFHGVDPLASAASAAFASANVWNVLGSSGFNVQDPAFANLVDSSGNPTGAGFSIIGKISAYGLGNPADALLTDYFYWNTPGATSTSIDWSITGLTPSRPHLLFVNGAHGGAFSMVVDEDANGDLGNDTTQVVSSPLGSGVLFYVMSDATGTITGRGTAISGEADWAGFQVIEHLEPSYPVAADTKKCQDAVAKIGGSTSPTATRRSPTAADC